MKRKKTPAILKELNEHVEASYFLYKICEGCDKLLLFEHNVCPNCNSYRFETKKSKVVPELKKFLKREHEFISKLIKTPEV